MLDTGETGYWVNARGICDATWPRVYPIWQPGIWQIQARKVENRTDFTFNYGIEREQDKEHTLDLLSNILFQSQTLNCSIELDCF